MNTTQTDTRARLDRIGRQLDEVADWIKAARGTSDEAVARDTFAALLRTQERIQNGHAA